MDIKDGDTRAKVRIISHSSELFRDRSQAGQLLAQELSYLKGKQAVVLGIPRGGIVVAQRLAEGIGAGLDIVLSRKLGAPDQPELAIGALAENGKFISISTWCRNCLFPVLTLNRKRNDRRRKSSAAAS